jgi:hypothetical protein
MLKSENKFNSQKRKRRAKLADHGDFARLLNSDFGFVSNFGSRLSGFPSDGIGVTPEMHSTLVCFRGKPVLYYGADSQRPHARVSKENYTLCKH